MQIGKSDLYVLSNPELSELVALEIALWRRTPKDPDFKFHDPQNRAFAECPRFAENLHDVLPLLERKGKYRATYHDHAEVFAISNQDYQVEMIEGPLGRPTKIVSRAHAKTLARAACFALLSAKWGLEL